MFWLSLAVSALAGWQQAGKCNAAIDRLGRFRAHASIGSGGRPWQLAHLVSGAAVDLTLLSLHLLLFYLLSRFLTTIAAPQPPTLEAIDPHRRPHATLTRRVESMKDAYLPSTHSFSSN